MSRILLLVGCCGLLFGQVVNPLGESGVEKFKKEIGYYEVTKKEGYSRVTLDGKQVEAVKDQLVMVGPWPKMADIPTLGKAWTLDYESVSANDDGLYYHWTLKSGFSEINIQCFNRETSESAESLFLGSSGRASSLYGMSYNHASSKKIGRLSSSSAPDEHGNPQATTVQNYNYVILVETNRVSLNPEIIAECLNSCAEKQLLPKTERVISIPERVEILPPYIRVGHKFEIRIIMPGGNQNNHYISLMSASVDNKSFRDVFRAVIGDNLDESNLTHAFIAKKAGNGVFGYYVIDKYTSQVYRGEIALEAHP